MTEHGDLKPRTPGKAPLALLPLAGLEVAAAALEHGALKYRPNNWRACPRDELGTYRHALLRHAAAFAIADERDDPESGVSHLGHIIACAAIMCHVLGLRYAPGKLAAAADREALLRLVSDEALFGTVPEGTVVPSDLKADPWALPEGLEWVSDGSGWFIQGLDHLLWISKLGASGKLLARPDAGALIELLRRRNAAEPDGGAR